MARTTETQEGTVVATVGRLVRVEAADRCWDCHLVGQRVVVGDRVRLRDATDGAGVIEAVLPRRTELRRAGPGGGSEVLAANLDGLLITASAGDPPIHPPLVDRFVLAGQEAGLEVVLVLNKCDLGVSEEIEEDLAVRVAIGLAVIRASAHRGDGVPELAARIGAGGTWALVGPSGAGKTSLARALLPDVDVGPIGAVSAHDRMGRHTTTGSTRFALGAGFIADAPGIRTFLPDLLDPDALARRFPGLDDPPCRYRDCLHRPGEDGCVASDTVHPRLLASYRRLLDEVLATRRRQVPGRRR